MLEGNHELQMDVQNVRVKVGVKASVKTVVVGLSLSYFMLDLSQSSLPAVESPATLKVETGSRQTRQAMEDMGGAH